MSSNSQTEFPKNLSLREINNTGFEIIDGEHGLPFLNRHEVNDWFKRCIEDIPVIPLRTLDYIKEYWRLSDWLEKWFSQFMEAEDSDSCA